MKVFESFRRSLRGMFSSVDATLDDVEAQLAEARKLGADVEPGTEKETVVEETLPDGTKRVTKTIVRRIIVK